MLTKVAVTEHHTTTNYSAEDHEVWDILSRKILPIQRGRFDPRFEVNVKHLGMTEGEIPPFEKLNQTLFKATGWRVYRPAAGTTTEDVLARFVERQFPVLQTMRPLSQIDRAEAPDLFHDYWGHLWMFLDPSIASIYETFGKQTMQAPDKASFRSLSLLYTNTLEFGLQCTEGRVQGFGAALASASEELIYALESSLPRRVRLDPTCESDVLRVMRTRYHFDELQETYFVVTDWQALHALLKSDLTPYYAKIADLPRLKPGEPCESDVLIAL